MCGGDEGSGSSPAVLVAGVPHCRWYSLLRESVSKPEMFYSVSACRKKLQQLGQGHPGNSSLAFSPL